MYCVPEISDPQQQKVDCGGAQLEFEVGTTMICTNCTIVQDNVCGLIMVSGSLGLSASASSGGTPTVHGPLSETRIIVDDSREPECCECSLNRAGCSFNRARVL